MKWLSFGKDQIKYLSLKIIVKIPSWDPNTQCTQLSFPSLYLLSYTFMIYSSKCKGQNTIYAFKWLTWAKFSMCIVLFTYMLGSLLLWLHIKMLFGFMYFSFYRCSHVTKDNSHVCRHAIEKLKRIVLKIE